MASMEDVISLSIGEPDFVTPWPIRDAAIRSIEAGHTHYTSNYGLMELREQLAGHLDRLYGLRYGPDERAADHEWRVGSAGRGDAGDRRSGGRGDPAGSVVRGVRARDLAGRGAPVAVRTVASEGFALSYAAVADAVTEKTRALLLGFPANPTGAVMPPEALARIAQLAVDSGLGGDLG